MTFPAAENDYASSPSPIHNSNLTQEKRRALSIWDRRKAVLTKRLKIAFIALFSCLTVVALALGLGLGLGLHHGLKATPVGPVVDLGYARYRGFNSSGVSQWLGMRYAATPTGKLRFAAPAPPPRQEGVQSATKDGNRCLGVRTSTSPNPSSPGFSEDCLFIQVYAPSNVTTGSNLPVYVYLQGGGFTVNGGTYNAASLIEASGMQIVVVDLNYRVGPHGFLAGEEVRKGGSLNNGLKDQRQALHWVKEHISKFGGNPNHVVLGGTSAGAASVTLQLAAYGGRDDGLFHATAAESQSFAALRTVEESQYQYDELVTRTNCDSAHTKSGDTLACLRQLSSDDLQGQNIGTPFPNTTRPPLFAYNPTLDHDFIPDFTLNLFSTGRFLKLPAIYGDPTNEGTVFVPRNLETAEASNNWLQAQFPALNSTQKTWFQETYPPATTKPNYTLNTSIYWQSTAEGYGELRYICPGLFLNNIYNRYAVKGNWNYRYEVLDPENEKNGYGSPHVAEVNAIWGAPAGSPPSYKTTNKNMIPMLQGYWTSFIRDLDPNTYRLPGTPTWEQWGTADFNDRASLGRRRIVFQNQAGKKTEMEEVSGKQWERCQKWSEWGISLAQ
ncbi:MAG: hypothetical protein Q9182_001076 [Xanthomendoza sp. 2 TL-2023]